MSSPPPWSISAARLGRFLRTHVLLVLSFPLVVVWGTLVHELAHAGACLLEGGSIAEISILPSVHTDGVRLGYVNYKDLPADANHTFVSLAPALLALVLAAVAAATLGRGEPRSRSMPVRFAYLLFVVLPLADVSMGAAGLFRGARSSDFYKALAGQELAVAATLVGVLLAYGVLARAVFRRVCDGELSAPEWWIGYALMMGLPHLRWGLS